MSLHVRKGKVILGFRLAAEATKRPLPPERRAFLCPSLSLKASSPPSLPFSWQPRLYTCHLIRLTTYVRVPYELLLHLPFLAPPQPRAVSAAAAQKWLHGYYDCRYTHKSSIATEGLILLSQKYYALKKWNCRLVNLQRFNPKLIS
jgi:hypothetical protein